MPSEALPAFQHHCTPYAFHLENIQESTYIHAGNIQSLFFSDLDRETESFHKYQTMRFFCSFLSIFSIFNFVSRTIFSPFLCSAHFPTFFRILYIYLNFLSQLNRKISGQVGFTPEKARKFNVFTAQTGILKVGRKWANGQKIGHFYPNSTNFTSYNRSISSKLLPKVGSQKQKWARI